jgi:LCP family protein required for cell wall assembly
VGGSHDWPEGWSRGTGSPGTPPPSRPSPPTTPVSPPLSPAPDSERTQVLPPVGSAPRRTSSGSQSPVTEEKPPRRGDHPPPPFARPRPRRTGPGRTVRRVLLVLLVVLALLVGLLLFFYARIAKTDALKDYAGRPSAGAGTNWLIVGSDSREGLSDQQIKTLHLGKIAGRRTDTIILLHKPDSGAPTLVSLPRDSWVPIPGHGRGKLNSAYAVGGAPLLVQTVETVTGLRIDHYAEIGFGGFVGMTDAVGGVQLCPKRHIRDHKSGLNVQKGCQQMDGAVALAYVRARYFDPQGDLGRVKRQQEFLGAVFDKAVSPTTLLNPFRILSLGNAATTALTIDQGDGPLSLLQFARTMRSVAGGGGKRLTVPVADINYRTSTGESAVRWDHQKALALFHTLRTT